jgi:beta-glucanase (GH16 family)
MLKTTHIALLLCAIIIFSCDKKADPNPIDVAPKITIESPSIIEGNAKTTCVFKLTLDKKTDKAVTVDYATADNTAIAGSDYEAKSGTLTFPANSLEGEIFVNIIGDTIRELEEVFIMRLTNATNATLLNEQGYGTIKNDDKFILISDDGFKSPTSYLGYSLQWSDEFNDDKINTNSWGYDIGGNGWGNNELQFYTDKTDNSFLSGGRLVIEAKPEKIGTNNYSSARLLSKGKQEFKYGRIDIRAKVPTGQGVWPALWMLGSNISAESWPACGEIDIMEVVGKEPKNLYGTLHWGNKGAPSISSSGKTTVSDPTIGDKFHVYTIVWDDKEINWFFDDVAFHKVTRSQVNANIYPFDSPFFLLMNVAVGGSWPGNPDGTTTFPQRMFVDYVRVFKKN